MNELPLYSIRTSTVVLLMNWAQMVLFFGVFVTVIFIIFFPPLQLFCRPQAHLGSPQTKTETLVATKESKTMYQLKVANVAAVFFFFFTSYTTIYNNRNIEPVAMTMNP